MERRNKVSVAMAAYNGEKFIQEQIASILPQLDEQDELIISLDPSTDRTREIINSFQDLRIQLIDGPGTGVIHNFENALMHCRGEVLFLCDQDDVWMPDKVTCLLQAFKETGSLLILHDARIVDANLEDMQVSFFDFKGTKPGFLRNFIKNSYIGCCMVFRKELLPYILPFPQDLPMHDQWIGLQAERYGKVSLLKKALLQYRRHGANVTKDSHASVAQMLLWRWRLLCALQKR